ncbi:hypothetical protein BFL43_18190 [Williamsia sp. 1135]|nr:hypothetical protein BFL43_18190 [Williamsia sp. 1135]
MLEGFDGFDAGQIDGQEVLAVDGELCERYAAVVASCWVDGVDGNGQGDGVDDAFAVGLKHFVRRA